MVWNVEVSIQSTVSTEIITRIGDQESRSGSLNAAIFDFNSGKFTIHTNPKRLCLEYRADDVPHAHFFVRAMEAMGFVIGRRLGWNYVEEWRQGTKIIRLRGMNQADEISLSAPLRNSVMDISGNTWHLFADFLRYILPKEGGNLHPLSIQLFQVYQARQGTIEAQALALGVAIEGLCKCLFPVSAEAEAQLKGWVKDLREHCEGWSGFQNEGARTALFQRLSGLIGTLPGVRAKDILNGLVSQNAVLREHVKAWVDLRNSAAHANLRPGSMQELVDLCAAVTVLMYHLIFKAIGYCGMYTDYSEYGYPAKRYGATTTEKGGDSPCALTGNCVQTESGR